MPLYSNPAVREAYAAGTYTDVRGVVWRRGMDGWFDDDYCDGAVFLCRHQDFVEMVEKEHPES